MFEQLLAELGQALATAGIRYMIIGGQAVLLYGEPRLTRDVDVTVLGTPDDLGRVLHVAQSLGLSPLVQPDTFVPETWVLPCEQPQTGIRVDFIFASSSYEMAALQRTHQVTIAGTEVAFVSPEDLVVHKIIAGRARDIEDVQALLAKRADVDDAYVLRWLSAFDEALGTDHCATFRRLWSDT